jgi:predicted nucleic acid-binding protein
VIVISDTSSITSLAAIGKLDLLKQLYTKILIPEAVYWELTSTSIPVPGAVEVQTFDWIEVRQVQNRSLITTLLKQQLDEGECEAIALAIELNAELLLIDERRGRGEANRLGLRIIGLLGVLVEAKQKRLIVVVKPLLDGLIATAGFRVGDALYTRILQIVGE